jgi:hypothetical protein
MAKRRYRIHRGGALATRPNPVSDELVADLADLLGLVRQSDVRRLETAVVKAVSIADPAPRGRVAPQPESVKVEAEGLGKACEGLEDALARLSSTTQGVLDRQGFARERIRRLRRTLREARMAARKAEQDDPARQPPPPPGRRVLAAVVWDLCRVFNAFLPESHPVHDRYEGPAYLEAREIEPPLETREETLRTAFVRMVLDGAGIPYPRGRDADDPAAGLGRFIRKIRPPVK